MTDKFIDRPILSIVVSVIITLLGILGLLSLPMTQFPNVAPPKVNVTVEYTGANTETVTKAAIMPIERAINGVPGMKYVSSDAGNDGVGNVAVLFETGTNVDLAAVNVQNRVSSIMGELPPEVIKNGVKINKEENAMLMFLNLYSTDTTIQDKFIYNFAQLNVIPELKRIKGVGYCNLMGAKQYAMRIWLKPDRMLAYNVSSDDVMEALQQQNVEAAPGKLGESSDKKKQALQYTVKYAGKFKTKEQYENIPVRSTENGQVLHIKDVADVEFGTAYFDVEARMNGGPCASIMIKQLPGSNGSEVVANVKKRLQELKQDAFLRGMDYKVSYDVSRFLDASVHEVVRTLIETFILVALVVFLFLQDWRSTLIPLIAVPVSLVGTFFFINLLGYSLNLITLFALVLAIGIVVDNAIVIVEAVHTKLQSGNYSPMQASKLAMKEIAGAIIAITLVMSAVFIPTSFMSGPSGIFYKQFSITMAISIILSGISALTLTPALCALMLKKEHSHKKGFINRFFDRFNSWYDKLSLKYQRLLSIIINRRVVTFIALLVFCIATGVLGRILPSGFIPNDDQGTFYANIVTPSGATLERTKEIANEIQRACTGLEPIESVVTLAGTTILSEGTGPTYGTALINLKPWNERDQSVTDVIRLLQEKTSHIKDAQIDFFPPPAVPGYGNASGFELRLLDKTGTDDAAQLQTVVKQFIEDLKTRPEIGTAFTIFDATYPQYEVKIDMDKAAQKAVTVTRALATLQTFLASDYATNFIRFGQMYRVMVQASPEYRAFPEDLMKLYVKNSNDEMVPLSSFMTIEKTYGADQTTRYNMYPSAEMNGEGNPGYSSGAVIKAIQETAKEKLPRGYGIDWGGISRDEVNAGNEAVYIFVICLLFVYLLLSAQYESFLLPLAVILSLPMGIFGAFLLLKLMGLENNIYTQVALIMLVGLLGKNAILIVEFAAQRHREGKSTVEAAIEGAKERLRPILMTSFAFIAGLLPLMFANSVGAIGNRTIGSAAAGGMLFGTMFGIVIVPGLYVVFATWSDKARKNEFKEEAPLTEEL